MFIRCALCIAILTGSFNCKLTAAEREITFNDIRVMKGFSPETSESIARHSTPDITFVRKTEEYDSQRKLYYFHKGPSGDQKTPVTKSPRQTTESIIYSLHDGDYVKTVFLADNAAASTSTTRSVIARGVGGAIGFVGGCIIAGFIQDKIDCKNNAAITLSGIFGALGGGLLGGKVEKRFSRPSLGRAESILGPKDRRIAVDDATSLPWRVHGHLQMSFSVGDYIGSGTLIGPSDVLTAAHNLYDQYRNEEVGAVSFYPGMSGKSAPWAAEGVTWTIHPRYKNPRMPFERKLYDIAVIKINGDLGTQLGYYGYGELDKMEEEVNVTGYPGKPGNGKFMYTAKGPLIGATSERLFYDIDTSPGQSGSGVWKSIKDIGSYCVAVHAYGSDNKDEEVLGKTYNSSTLITKEKYELIKSWTS